MSSDLLKTPPRSCVSHSQPAKRWSA